MNKEFVGNVLGIDYGIVRKVELTNGNVLKVKNDDWGHFVYVINPYGVILYASELIVHASEVDAEIERIGHLY
jgi:hypothetical protein